MSEVYLAETGTYDYPNDWNPGKRYAEYPFGDELNSEGNHIYAAVRECLHGLGYDKAHYGTSEWNPLGDLVSPGQTIVVKPNWVLEANKGCPDNPRSMECLVTHPSVIRAICDYCIIALKGKGRLIIGDAPVQDCDLAALHRRMGYPKIKEFYEKQGLNIVELADFRAYLSHMNKMKVIDRHTPNAEGIEVDLKNLSVQRNNLGGHYVQVANYDRRITTEYHTDGHHIYSIAKPALEADLIINLPKPKTHRLAGMTGALKNLVGIACKKETLPHRTSGDMPSGGDSYEHPSWLKRMADRGLNLKTYQEHEGKTLAATFTWLWAGFFCLLSKKFAPDPYLMGSWRGNDTIWRTVIDLNYIMRFADKEGALRCEPQRRIFNVADMVVAGEGSGPLRPTPKECGLILASEDSVAMDMTITQLMGFDWEKIPLLAAVQHGETFFLPNSVDVISSKGSFDGLVTLDFKPHPAWNNIRVSNDETPPVIET